MSYLTVEDSFQFFPKLPSGNLLEFGVFSGNCLNRLINGAEAAGFPFVNVYGFDSFVGLPKETPGVYQNPEWPEAAFSLCNDYKLNSIDEAMDFVRGRVDRKDITLVPGFFDKSLDETWGNLLRNSASYIHIDVDIHRSSVEVLDFVFTYEIPKIGCLIRYDDWCSTPEYRGGNSLAHIDAERKYKVKFNRVATNIFQYLGQCV